MFHVQKIATSITVLHKNVIQQMRAALYSHIWGVCLCAQTRLINLNFKKHVDVFV